MGKKAREYKPGDFCFAKVKGYPAWPARVKSFNGKKYLVYFYGTGETANLPSNMIFDFAENKDKFLSKSIKRKDFNEGVAQIEYDIENNIPLPEDDGAAPTINDSQLDATTVEDGDKTVNDDNDAADESGVETQESETEKPAEQNAGTETGIEDSDEGQLIIDEGKQKDAPKRKGRPPKGKSGEFSTPKSEAKPGKKEKAIGTPAAVEAEAPEVVSRSGRKIRPKRFLDAALEENPTVPSPAPKKAAKEKPDKIAEVSTDASDTPPSSQDQNGKHYHTVNQSSRRNSSSVDNFSHDTRTNARVKSKKSNITKCLVIPLVNNLGRNKRKKPVKRDSLNVDVRRSSRIATRRQSLQYDYRNIEGLALFKPVRRDSLNVDLRRSSRIAIRRQSLQYDYTNIDKSTSLEPFSISSILENNKAVRVSARLESRRKQVLDQLQNFDLDSEDYDSQDSCSNCFLCSDISNANKLPAKTRHEFVKNEQSPKRLNKSTGEKDLEENSVEIITKSDTNNKVIMDRIKRCKFVPPVKTTVSKIDTAVEKLPNLELSDSNPSHSNITLEKVIPASTSSVNNEIIENGGNNDFTNVTGLEKWPSYGNTAESNILASLPDNTHLNEYPKNGITDDLQNNDNFNLSQIIQNIPEADKVFEIIKNDSVNVTDSDILRDETNSGIKLSTGQAILSAVNILNNNNSFTLSRSNSIISDEIKNSQNSYASPAKIITDLDQLNNTNADQLCNTNSNQLNITNTDQLNITNTDQLNIRNSDLNIPNADLNITNADLNITNADLLANLQQVVQQAKDIVGSERSKFEVRGDVSPIHSLGSKDARCSAMLMNIEFGDIGFNRFFADIAKEAKSSSEDSDLDSAGGVPKQNILIARLPNGNLVGIKLFQDRPATFKDETARIEWDNRAAKNAIALKKQLESGEIESSSVQTQLELELNLTEEEKANLDKERENEEKRKNIEFLKCEMKLVELDGEIKQCLGYQKADVEQCTQCLDQLAELDVKAIMLLKHPSTLETVKRLRAYIGNTTQWTLTEEETLEFKKKAHLIRQKAQEITTKFKSLFQFPKSLSFWEGFGDKVLRFKKATAHLSAEQVLELTTEPASINEPSEYTCEAAVTAANHTETEPDAVNDDGKIEEDGDEKRSNKRKADEPTDNGEAEEDAEKTTKQKKIEAADGKSPSKRKSK